MPEECLTCRDNFEDDAICFCCYQALLSELKKLRERVKELEGPKL